MKNLFKAFKISAHNFYECQQETHKLHLSIDYLIV